MVEAILLVVCFGLFMFIGIRETKTRQDKENHAIWLSECRECTHSIENEFRRRCHEITENTISLYNEYLIYNCVLIEGHPHITQINTVIYITDNHHKAIKELKDEYISESKKKIEQRQMYGITSIPDHLAKEYEKNISEIAETYYNFGKLLSAKVSEIRDKNI